LLGIVSLLDWRGIISLGEICQPFFLFLSSNIVGPIILGCIAVLLYFLNYKLLKDHARIDDGLLRIKPKMVTSKNYGIFDRFNPEIGRIMELDTKLILRNKRTKSFILATLLFVFYPFLLSDSFEDFSSYGFLLFVGIFAVGGFTLNFGQVMFAINSSHFDQLLSHPIKFKDYINAKITLLTCVNIGLLILTIPYGFISTKFLLTNTAISLFMTGFVIYIYVFIGLKYAKKFEINAGTMFNMQGFNAAHFVVMIPIMILPFLIYLPFKFLGYPILGVIGVGLLGITGIILKKQIVKRAAARLQLDKHIINSNYKK